MNKYEVICHYASGSVGTVGSTIVVVESEYNQLDLTNKYAQHMHDGSVLCGNNTIINLKWVQLIEIRQLPNEDSEHGDD